MIDNIVFADDYVKRREKMKFRVISENRIRFTMSIMQRDIPLECLSSSDTNQPYLNISINNLASTDVENFTNQEIEEFTDQEIEGSTLEDFISENCTYKELQYLAKQHSIKANIKKEDLIIALENVRNNKDVVDEHRTQLFLQNNSKKYMNTCLALLLLFVVFIVLPIVFKH